MSVKSETTRVLSTVLYRSGLLGPVSSAVGYARRVKGFPVLAFHRVNDDDDPFMPALPTALFAARMEHIARHYTVLTVEDLVERLRRDHPYQSFPDWRPLVVMPRMNFGDKWFPWGKLHNEFKLRKARVLSWGSRLKRRLRT